MWGWLSAPTHTRCVAAKLATVDSSTVSYGVTVDSPDGVRVIVSVGAEYQPGLGVGIVTEPTAET